MGSCYSFQTKPIHQNKHSMSELNLDSILIHLTATETELPLKHQTDSLLAIEHEINKLRRLQFNYSGFSLKNSDQFIIDVLSFTCFSRNDQFNSIKLYIDVINKKTVPINKRINIDDLYLSCLDAISPKTTILILNEYLRSASGSIKERCKEIDGSTIVDVVLRRFEMFLFGFRCGVHESFTDTHFEDFNDYRFLIAQLIQSEFQLSNSQCLNRLDHKTKNNLLFQIFLEETCCSFMKTDELLNEFLTHFLEKLVNFEKISLPAFVMNTHGLNNSGEISNELRVKIKFAFYNKLKKSRLVKMTEQNSGLLRQMIMQEEKVFFQPLGLKELCQRSVDAKSWTLLTGNCKSKSFVDFVCYEHEPHENILLYFI